MVKREYTILIKALMLFNGSDHQSDITQKEIQDLIQKLDQLYREAAE